MHSYISAGKAITFASSILALSVLGISASNAAASQGGYAVINADGSLGKNFNVQNVMHTPLSGNYTVQFIHSTNDCVAEATIQGDPGLVLPGYITIVRPDSKTVQVTTYATLPLLPADFKFSLGMICSK